MNTEVRGGQMGLAARARYKLHVQQRRLRPPVVHLAERLAAKQDERLDYADTVVRIGIFAFVDDDVANLVVLDLIDGRSGWEGVEADEPLEI